GETEGEKAAAVTAGFSLTPASWKVIAPWGRGKKLALITELFCTYMAPLCRMSRGTTGESDTGKRDSRHHSRTGCVEKRQVVQGCFCNPHRQVKAVLHDATHQRG